MLAAVLASAPPAVVGEPVEILNLPQAGTDPEKIDYAKLPRIEGTLTVIAPAVLHAPSAGKAKIDLHDLRFQLHNYLA
jgi:hypothetical protein